MKHLVHPIRPSGRSSAHRIGGSLLGLSMVGGLVLAGPTGCDDSKRFSETKSTNISIQPQIGVYEAVPPGMQSVAKVFSIQQDGEVALKVSTIRLQSSGFADAGRCDRVSLGIGRNDPLPSDLAESCHFLIEERGGGLPLPWTLGVGQQLQVNVAYNSIGTPPGQWNLLVESNALNTPSFSIPLQVQVEQPEFGGDLARAFPITGGTEFVVVRNVGTGSLVVDSLTVSYLTDLPVDPVTQMPVQEFRVRADRELPWAINNTGLETLTVTYEPIDEEADVADIVLTSSNAAQGEHRIRLTSQAQQSVIEVSPNPVIFGQPSGAEREARRVLTVANRGLKSLDVSSLLIDQPSLDPVEYRLDPSVPTSFQLRPGQTLDVTITYTPASGEGNDATLLITSDADVGADAQNFTAVPLVRSGDRLPAILTVDPPILQFNEVPGGDSGSQTITLTNPGAQPLEVSRIGFSTADDAPDLVSDPEFSIASGGGATTIAPGESHTIEVLLARPADDRRALAAVLLVDSNAEPARTRIYMTSAPLPAN